MDNDSNEWDQQMRQLADMHRMNAEVNSHRALLISITDDIQTAIDHIEETIWQLEFDKESPYDNRRDQQYYSRFINRILNALNPVVTRLTQGVQTQRILDVLAPIQDIMNRLNNIIPISDHDEALHHMRDIIGDLFEEREDALASIVQLSRMMDRMVGYAEAIGLEESQPFTNNKTPKIE